MFLSPMMLAFCGAAVIPLVLHLLSRSKQTEVRWGAMMFLDEASPRRSRMRRLRQYVVLLLRSLAIVMLALAMARPVTGSGTSLKPPGRAAVAVIVDVSGSTGAPTGAGANRLDAIRESAGRLLGALAEGDVAALLVEDASLAPVFTADRAALMARLSAVRPGAVTLDLGSALERAATLLGGQGATSRIIAVVTDRQAVTYAGLDEAFFSQFSATMERQGITRVLFLPSGDRDRDNVSVREIEVLNPPVLRGRPALIRVTLRNDGSTPRAGFGVTIKSPGQADVPVKVDLGADTEGTVVIPMTFGSGVGGGGTGEVKAGGRVVVTAEIAPTGPTFDDRLSRVIDVGEGTRVLVVSGAGGGGAGSGAGSRGGAVGGAALALSPLAAAGKSGDTVVVTATAERRLPVLDLDRYAVVMIPHLQSMTEEEVRGLEQFVYAGGGLVVGVGPLTGEETLARMGPMLPAKVGAVSLAGGPPMRVELGGTGGAGGVMAGAVVNPADVFPGASVFRYRTMELVQGATAMLRLPGSAVLWAEGKFGKGTVILSGSPLEGPWNDLSRSVGYVPVMQAAVRHAAGPPPDAVNLKVGEMLAVGLPAGTDVRSVALTTPGGVVVPVVVEQRSAGELGRGPGAELGGVVVRYGPVRVPGLYEIRYRMLVSDPAQGARVEPAYVRAPEAESDLRSDDGMIARVAGGLGAVVIGGVGGGAGGVELSAADLRHGRELWGIALALAVLILGCEVVVSRYWQG